MLIQCAGVKKYGRLDIIANNAGISVESTHDVPHGIHELSESDWDKTMAINVKGVFLGCKYGIRQMLKQEPLPGQKDRGWIVNTASVQGFVAYHNTRKCLCQLLYFWDSDIATCSRVHRIKGRRSSVDQTSSTRLRFRPNPLQCNSARLLTNGHDTEPTE